MQSEYGSLYDGDQWRQCVYDSVNSQASERESGSNSSVDSGI